MKLVLHRKLDKRIFLPFIGVFLLLFVFTVFFQYRREKEFKTEHLDLLLESNNNFVNQYLNDDDVYHEFITTDQDSEDAEEIREALFVNLKRLIRSMPDTSIRVTILSPEGDMFFDSRLEDMAAYYNVAHHPEIVAAKKHKVGKSIRQSVTIPKTYYFVANNYGNRYIRSGVVYDLKLKEALEASTGFLYSMVLVFVIAFVFIFIIASNLRNSIEGLNGFIQKAEKAELSENDMNIAFPKDELGEISRNIIRLYTQLSNAKDRIRKEWDKIIKHLQFLREGLGVFDETKKELFVNVHFMQFLNLISDSHCSSPSDIFALPEFHEINNFMDDASFNEEVCKKQIVIGKDNNFFMVLCIAFMDRTFEISISDVTRQQRESKLKKELTQNLSHELKTPVSSILGYIESIINAPNEFDEEKKKLFIQKAYMQAMRLNLLLRDISTINRLDENVQMFEKVKCNLADVVEEVLRDVDLQIKRGFCRIVKRYPKNMLVVANHSLIYSIFKNLIENSLVHGEDTTSIEIDSYRNDSEFYYFTFADNGVGVPNEHLSKIFDRFYCVKKNKSTTTRWTSTGLGLSIVENAIMFHGGTISAKNISGGGLMFVFTLKREFN
ncbi:MAG: HAMP domain-containing histidine kinase [Prevotellaceae bacterium]|jgi:signal transduction histidine kinase|nr:HAMP domain-containing histidine kinase [Prevotellaceae bacterium]